MWFAFKAKADSSNRHQVYSPNGATPILRIGVAKHAIVRREIFKSLMSFTRIRLASSAQAKIYTRER
jgi:hypothetical protein